jgi:hypothetical protein
MKCFLPSGLSALLCVALSLPVFAQQIAAPSVSATLGNFITPVETTASSAQSGAGRTAQRLIDSSGWGETAPGSGVFVHSANVYADGASMWNGDPDSWLLFDLGQSFNLSGVYVWNYNEGNGWNSRSVKELQISASTDNKEFAPVGDFTLQQAPGKEDYSGQPVKFPRVLRARYIKFQIKSNYKGGENSGLAEVRFANADKPFVRKVPAPWKSTYARPQHPRGPLGRVLAGQENIVYPADAGIIDVTKAPYFAKGDGVADNTAAIQKALNDYPNDGAIIYFPNGVYLISDTLHYSYGNDGNAAKNTVLQGQSRVGAVIKLKDNCSGYQSPRVPRAMVWTGQAPAQRFGNEIHNLTFDAGVGNAGAVGVQFIANNQGGMYNVAILSGDGQGVIGLDMGYTDEQGPCFIKERASTRIRCRRACRHKRCFGNAGKHHT